MMTRQALRPVRAAGKAALLAGLLLAACRPGTPQPQPTAIPPATFPPETPTPASSPPPPQTLPTTSTGFAPGTVIADQVLNLESLPNSQGEVSFDGLGMQVIRLDTSLLGGTLAYDVELVDVFGNTLAAFTVEEGETSASIAEFTLPYEGRYQVIVSATGGSGSVGVTVTALGPPSGGGELDGPGSSATGEMNDERVYHVYQFPLAEGEVVSISAIADTPGMPDTRLALYGPDGRYITAVDDVNPPDDLNAVLSRFVAPLTGTYTAVVSNYGGSTGTYTFSVNPDTIPPEAEGEPDIVYDTVYRAAFFEGSSLNATFDGEIGDVLRIEAFDLEPELDVDIYLYSPFDQIIAFAVNAGAGEAEAVNEVQLPYTGRYRLELRPLGSGQGSFQIVHLPAGNLSGGGIFGDDLTKTLPGRFEAPNVYHFYQFNATAGEMITLSVTSTSEEGELDIGFAVLGPDGIQQVFADDSEGDNPADPVLSGYEVPQTGTYTVVVYSFNDATGSYQITFSRE
ncbi:MAG TPA: hypothetical protein ENI95_02530 [Chloroflexi bacterium]|nr:hypothetical protein [Chloroflexota bacterium]